jgi:hypothetical protein
MNLIFRLVLLYSCCVLRQYRLLWAPGKGLTHAKEQHQRDTPDSHIDRNIYETSANFRNMLNGKRNGVKRAPRCFQIIFPGHADFEGQRTEFLRYKEKAIEIRSTSVSDNSLIVFSTYGLLLELLGTLTKAL